MPRTTRVRPPTAGLAGAMARLDKAVEDMNSVAEAIRQREVAGRGARKVYIVTYRPDADTCRVHAVYSSLRAAVAEAAAMGGDYNVETSESGSDGFTVND